MMATEEPRGADEQRPLTIWDDPSIPAGNSPPLPAWPLVLSAVAFAGWIGFLMVTAVSR